MPRLLTLLALFGTLALSGGGLHAHGPGGHAGATPASAEQQAWGIAGNPGRVNRTVVVRMRDTMRFYPNRIRVRKGETIRFVVRNEGRMLHEMVIGTPAVLKEHAELMRRFPAMEHDAPWMVHVEPGAAGEIVWHFNRPGAFEYACLIPGHYEAGMVGRIEVVDRGR